MECYGHLYIQVHVHVIYADMTFQVHGSMQTHLSHLIERL